MLKLSILVFTIFALTLLVQPIEAVNDNPFNEYPIPQNRSNSFAITTDDNGNVWFSQRNIHSIARFNPESLTFKSYPVPTKQESLEIWGITIGPRGFIWFSDATENKIRHLDPETGKFFDFLILNNDSLPWDLKFDTDNNLWFTEFGTGKLARVEILDPTSLIEYEIPSNFSSPSYLEFDAQGNIWIVESGPGKLAKFNPDTNIFTEYILPHDDVGGGTVNPIGLAIDKNGDIWFSQFRTSRIGQLNPDTGQIKEYSTGTLTAGTYQIIADNDGNIWTIQFRADRLIKISPSDKMISEYKIPSNNTFAETLVSDKFGNIWFIERDTNTLGFLNSSKPKPIQIVFDTKNFQIAKHRDSITTMKVKSDQQTFFLARGNMRVTGILDAFDVTFSPSRIEKTDSFSDIQVNLNSDRELENGIYYLTIGASTMDLAYYRGTFIEINVIDSVYDPLFLVGIILSIISAVVIWRKK